MVKRKDSLKDLRAMSEVLIAKKNTTLHKRLIELNQEKILGKLKNVGEIKQIRRLIATGHTILNEKITASIETQGSGK